MSNVEKLKEQYKIGQNIFEELFKLSDNELKIKIIDILGENNHNEVLNNDCTITRTIINETPDKIIFSYYDSVKINYQGILIMPEHGGEYLIIKFNKYFKLN
jgi:hypothetical protein